MSKKLASGWLGLVIGLGLLGCVGCSRPSEKPAAAPFDSMRADRTFQTRGEVRELGKDGKTAVIRHEEIPGYMPKMTMELNVRNPAELREVRAGDTVEFRLNVNGEAHWIDEIRKSSVAVAPTAPATNAAPAAPATTVDGMLAVGAEFPDVSLTGEDGRVFRLSELRGKAVAFTFIFTRCPLPDFCPRMGQQLKAARRQLLGANGPTNWMFLSISFDAEYDRPEVLTKYARSYRGESAERWMFCAAEPKAVAEMSAGIGLTVVADSGSFSHNLRTVVLDPKGRLFRTFTGNLWTPAELVEAVNQAAGTK